MAADDTIRVLRVIEYTGPRQRVEDQVARSLHGEKRLPNGVVIRAATVGAYPEMLEGLEEVSIPPNMDGLQELCQCGHRWGIHESGMKPVCLIRDCSCQQFRSINPMSHDWTEQQQAIFHEAEHGSGSFKCQGKGRYF